jgi:hypothetical protein
MKIIESELDRISQSTLGILINIFKMDNPILPSRSEDLAEEISKEFNVVCTKNDIEKFYNLDDIDNFDTLNNTI